MTKLKHEEQLRKTIYDTLYNGGSNIMGNVIDVILKYIMENYSTDWEVGNFIKSPLLPTRKIIDIKLCAMFRDGEDYKYESIDELKLDGYTNEPEPEITPETIALKFGVDVDTVKKLLKKIK